MLALLALPALRPRVRVEALLWLGELHGKG